MTMKLGKHPIKAWTFPDGQPHVEVPEEALWGPAELRCRITSPAELFQVVQVGQILEKKLGQGPNLVVSYLMGSRMDRPMPTSAAPRHGKEAESGFAISDRPMPDRDAHMQPFTLKTVTDILKLVPWGKITLLDPHSDVSVALLDAEVALPTRLVEKVWTSLDRPIIIVPDAGGMKRVEAMVSTFSDPSYTIQALKHRDMATGKLSGFQVVNPEVLPGKPVLILDDLCDGGGTFVGLAEVLYRHGARGIHLYVTHGVFSKGFDLPGIDTIHTTSSYHDGDWWDVHLAPEDPAYNSIHVYPWEDCL